MGWTSIPGATWTYWPATPRGFRSATSPFDTVAIIAALNHITRRDEALREARRVLRPGGRLLVTMIPPGISRCWHFLRRPWDADQKHRIKADGECWGMKRAEVHRLLTQSGFAVRRETRFMLFINCLTIAEKASA